MSLRLKNVSRGRLKLSLAAQKLHGLQAAVTYLSKLVAALRTVQATPAFIHSRHNRKPRATEMPIFRRLWKPVSEKSSCEIIAAAKGDPIVDNLKRDLEPIEAAQQKRWVALEWDDADCVMIFSATNCVKNSVLMRETSRRPKLLSSHGRSSRVGNHVRKNKVRFNPNTEEIPSCICVHNSNGTDDSYFAVLKPRTCSPGTVLSKLQFPETSICEVEVGDIPVIDSLDLNHA